MTSPPPRRPAQTLGEILEDRERMRRALQLIADAVDALSDPPEHIRMLGAVAKMALRG
jgi:hypothetical protein